MSDDHPAPDDPQGLGHQVLQEIEQLASDLMYLCARNSPPGKMLADQYAREHDALVADANAKITQLIEAGADMEVMWEDGTTAIEQAFSNSLPASTVFLLVKQLEENNEWLVDSLGSYLQTRLRHLPNPISVEQWAIAESLPKNLSKEDARRWYALHPALPTLRDQHALDEATPATSKNGRKKRL